MSEEEYKECLYIDAEMSIFDYTDFRDNARAIKSLYKKLKHKMFYCWYLYANIHMNLKQKDMIWNYLNDDITLEQLDNISLKSSKFARNSKL